MKFIYKLMVNNLLLIILLRGFNTQCLVNTPEMTCSLTFELQTRADYCSNGEQGYLCGTDCDQKDCDVFKCVADLQSSYGLTVDICGKNSRFYSDSNSYCVDLVLGLVSGFIDYEKCPTNGNPCDESANCCQQSCQ